MNSRAAAKKSIRNNKNQNIFFPLLSTLRCRPHPNLVGGPRSPKRSWLDGYLICLRKRIDEAEAIKSERMENINLCIRWTGKFFDIKNRFSSHPDRGWWEREGGVGGTTFPLLIEKKSSPTLACLQYNRILGETEFFLYLFASFSAILEI